MKKSKKTFNQKVKQINRIFRAYEEMIDFHQNRYKFLVKLSLDYEYAVSECKYKPSHDANEDTKEIFAFSQKHVQMRASYVKRYLEFQKFVKKQRLSFVTSSIRLNEKSYFDDLI